jgi:undecaprenyl-diphosphatase
MSSLEAIDQGSHPWFLLLHRPWLDPLMVAITALGSRRVLTAFVVLLDVFLLFRRQARTALLLAGIGLTAMLLDTGMKELVQRPRPEVVRPLVPVPADWSFPSGHALGSTAVYVSAALLLTVAPVRRRLRVLTLIAALLLAFLIGFSRLYLGVHYVTDVVGGWVAGLALALFGLWMEERGRREPPSVR